MKFVFEVPDDVLREFLREIARYVRIETVKTDGSLLSKKPYELPLPRQPIYTTRAYNALRNYSYYDRGGPILHTIEDLCREEEHQFRERKHLGDKTVRFVIKALNAAGLRFGMKDADFQAYQEGKFDPKGS